MKLFSRRKSVTASNSSDIRSNHRNSPLPPTSTSRPFERPAEVSTPLYERFARSKTFDSPGQSSSSLNAFGGKPRPSDGSRFDPLLDAPPTSYFSRNQSSNGSSSTLQSVSAEKPLVGARSPGSAPVSHFPQPSKPESHRKSSVPAKEISRPLVLNGSRNSPTTSPSKSKTTRGRSGTVNEKTSSPMPPAASPPNTSPFSSPRQDSRLNPPLETPSPSAMNATAQTTDSQYTEVPQTLIESDRSNAKPSDHNHPVIEEPQISLPLRESNKGTELVASPSSPTQIPLPPFAEMKPKPPNISSVSLFSTQKHSPAIMKPRVAAVTVTEPPSISAIKCQSPDTPLPSVQPQHSGPAKARSTPPVSGSPKITRRCSLSQTADSKSPRMGAQVPPPPITYDLFSTPKFRLPPPSAPSTLPAPSYQPVSRPSADTLQRDNSTSSQATTSAQQSTSSSQTSLNSQESRTVHHQTLAKEVASSARNTPSTPRRRSTNSSPRISLITMPEIKTIPAAPSLNTERLSDVMPQGGSNKVDFNGVQLPSSTMFSIEPPPSAAPAIEPTADRHHPTSEPDPPTPTRNQSTQLPSADNHHRRLRHSKRFPSIPSHHDIPDIDELLTPKPVSKHKHRKRGREKEREMDHRVSPNDVTQEGSHPGELEEEPRQKERKRRSKHHKKTKDRNVLTMTTGSTSAAESLFSALELEPQPKFRLDFGPDVEPEPEPVPEPEPEPPRYPLEEHLLLPNLLAPLLPYLNFRTFYNLWTVSRVVYRAIEEVDELRELVLLRYLSSVGYRTWTFERREPVIISVGDLNAYLRGVNIPVHQFPVIADRSLLDQHDGLRALEVTILARLMADSCQAYTKLVLRLRAQGEFEQLIYDQSHHERALMGALGRSGFESMDAIPPPVPAKAFPPTTRPRKRRSISSTRSVPRNHQRRPSTAGSVANSFVDPSTQQQQQPFDARYHRFRSPLHRLGHAPLLRVFVPSPEGNWLSDSNVIRCEEELRKAGIVHLLKTGDVVWDVAVGEEGNVGRLIWDGAYLIDLDYSYSLTGELPPYVDSLCFPPSYWHKVLRIAGNPICYLDIRPYSQEIAMNIALIQSRVQTETPQGHLHNVVRWIHRSSFQIRSETPLLPIQPNSTYHGRTPTIDAAWEGTVFIEAEGTNEGLEDLQARCGNTVQLVAPKPGVVVKKLPSAKGKTIFRMVRGSSRPGELWLRCVSEKERVL